MIGLVDSNNFYVSCERVFDLSLEGKPVAVLSNNDGCVISRSQEFKALDIPMGTPYFQLKPRIKGDGLIFRSSNYALYGDLSRRIISILNLYTPDVEQYSIDEAFIHMNRREETDFEALGLEIRAKILKWVGIPCGIGFAPTKTLAKIANHIGKRSPSGLFLMPEDPSPILKGLPLSEVWGIGRRLAPKMEQLGIRTALDLARADPNMLKQRFSVVQAQTALELRGIPCFGEEDPERPPQSVSCSRSFGKPVTTVEALRESIAFHLATACEKLRKSRLRAGMVTLYSQSYPERISKATAGEYRALTLNLKMPTAATSRLLEEALPLAERLYREGRRYKKTGVLLFGLEPLARTRLDLFQEDDRNERAERLSSLMDRLNGKFGRGTLFHLSEGIGREWERVPRPNFPFSLSIRDESRSALSFRSSS